MKFLLVIMLACFAVAQVDKCTVCKATVSFVETSVQEHKTPILNFVNSTCLHSEPPFICSKIVDYSSKMIDRLVQLPPDTICETFCSKNMRRLVKKLLTLSDLIHVKKSFRALKIKQ